MKKQDQFVSKDKNKNCLEFKEKNIEFKRTKN